MSLKRREVIKDLKDLVNSAEEILDLKDELEFRIVERGKGSGLRPTSVVEAKEKLELKKRQHKELWKKIKANYEPFLMELIQSQPPYTPQGLQSEPEPEPGPRHKRPPHEGIPPPVRKGRRKSAKSKKKIKNKKKKQTKKYKRLR